MNSSKPNTAVPVRVWDLPTRIFHWLLAACVIGSAVSAQLGGNAMVWHFRLGYTICTLLVFRLLWGLVGLPAIIRPAIRVRIAFTPAQVRIWLVMLCGKKSEGGNIVWPSARKG